MDSRHTGFPQDCLKGLNAIPRRSLVRCAVVFIQGQKIYFYRQPFEQLNQAIGVIGTIIEVFQHHVFNGELSPWSKRVGVERRDEFLEWPLLVDGHHFVPCGVGCGIQRDCELGWQVASKVMNSRNDS